MSKEEESIVPCEACGSLPCLMCGLCACECECGKEEEDEKEE